MDENKDMFLLVKDENKDIINQISPQMRTICILAVVVLICLSHCETPPVWPEQFQQDFVESFSTTAVHDIGKLWYDSNSKMSRLDRSNGRFDPICGSVINATTPCSQLTRLGVRYVVFPNIKSCCVCCDAAHGCGIMRRDWLATAKFQGVDELSGQLFSKWSIPDGDEMDYYWSSRDGKNIPRKLSEANEQFKDFILNTYSEAPIDQSVFVLPPICSGAALCPAASMCGRFRENAKSLSVDQQ